MTQAEKIINLLRERGETGALNIELNKIAFRYSARINELRKAGHTINIIHIDKSIWKYQLIEE